MRRCFILLESQLCCVGHILGIAVLVESIEDICITVLHFYFLTSEGVSVHIVVQLLYLSALAAGLSLWVLLRMLQSFQHHFKGILKAGFWFVEVGELDGKVEGENELVGAVADSVGKIYEVGVHDEGLFSDCKLQGGKAFEHLSHMHVVHLVDFDEVLEEHEDYVGKEARLFAEISMLEQIEDLRRDRLKAFVVFQDLSRT